MINNQSIKVTLNKWDDLAPLKEQQLKSIFLLNQLNQFELNRNDNLNAYSDFSSLSDVNKSELEDEVFVNNKNDHSSNENNLSNNNISFQINEDVNDLLYNFDVNDIEDVRIEKYVSNLNKNLKKTTIVSKSIEDALKNLKFLLENYSHVSQKTKSLHVACEQLLNDQTKLVNASYILNTRLSYFTDMDIFMQKLNSPTIENNCEYVIPMLTRIDECLNYLETNISQKESQNYIQIVLQVLRKALSIIKNYTINSLNSVSNSILQSMQTESVNQIVKFSADNSYTMFYSKFRVNSSRIKTLMEQLEQRVELNNQLDYEQALAECHQCYIQNRKSFILNSVTYAINDLVQKYQRDTCTLVRSSCSFMIHLCQDENQLYKNFFGRTSIFFEKFLEELCMILYDRLRPIIIHVVHIETLAELCSILKTEILMDNIKTNADHLSVFEAVCSQMLEDVQERFVYRTHIYISEEILGYKPSSGDLSYPEKLEIMQKIAEGLKKSSSNNESLNESSDTYLTDQSDAPKKFQRNTVNQSDAHGMWYPTLRRTLICLSKLYRCLDKKIFEGLAQETLTMCVQSLIKASDIIKKDKSVKDGELFLIKNLLILREQISPFNNEFSVVEVQLDFSRLKDAAYGAFRKEKLFRLDRDNAFLDFLLNGTLEAKENLVDSKREVDNQLKKSCELFIEYVCEEIFGSIKEIVKNMKTILKISSDQNAPKVSLKQQPFAKPENLADLFASNYKDVRKKFPSISYSMSLYLSNKDIEQIILKRIKNNIQQNYMELSSIISKNYNEEEQLIIACPTSEQISLWLTVS